jgi:hypothetical protein
MDVNQWTSEKTYLPKVPYEKNYYVETILKYKPFDGGVGYIVKIRPKSYNSNLKEK